MTEIIRADVLAGIPHGFSGRDGLAASDISPSGTLTRAKQVHSSDVLVVDADWQDMAPGDALVTARRDVVLAIVTADCAPVLLADVEAGVIGAAHAGWRGAHGGVIGNTVAAMESLGARGDRIRAAIGPTIARTSYEVDADFREQFGEQDAKFFSPGVSAQRWQFDLPAYVSQALAAAGVGTVQDLALDTYADERRFHSFRRATHRSAPTGGRQVSAIALP